jgi:hypothetical protein
MPDPIPPAHPQFPEEPGLPEIGDPIPGQPPIPGEDDPFGFPDPPQIPEIGDPIQASGDLL